MKKAVKRRTSISKVPIGSELVSEIQVVRELWYNEDSCKGAYLVEMESGDRVSIKGDFHAQLVPNLDYEIHGIVGEFKGSKQITVEYYKTIQPQTRHAMIALLKSVPGIKTKATALYELYQQDCLDVLRNDPERIIKEAKVMRKWAYKAQEYLLFELDGEEYITKLMNYGLTIKEAKTLYEKYKDEVLKVLEENPYILTQKVRGFGFNKCEKIAHEMRFDMYSPYRIEAGIVHCLELATQSGHCFLPGNQLVHEVVQLLQRQDAFIHSQHIFPVLQQMLDQGEVCIEKERVYLKRYHEMEQEVCEKITRLTTGLALRSKEEVEEALNRVLAREPELVLEDKQREAIIEANMKRGGVFVLNGHAGTGKTFTLRLLIEVYHELASVEKSLVDIDGILDLCQDEEEISQLVAAIVEGYAEEVQSLKELGKTSEARALECLYEEIEEEDDIFEFLRQILLVCEGKHIQSHLPENNVIATFQQQVKSRLKKPTKKKSKKIDPNNVLYLAPTGKAAKVMSKATNQPASTIHKGLHYDVVTHDFKHGEGDPLIQDVIVCDETSMLDLWLFNKLLKAIKPGTKLILLGDTNQLPSIGAGNVLKDLLESQVVDNVTLTIVKRQGLLSDILKNAKNILEGQIIQNYDETNDAYFIQKNNPADIQDVILNQIEELLKDPEYTIDEIQVLSPMRKGPLGTNMLNYLIQQRFNPGVDDRSEYAVTFESPIGYGESEKITLYFKRGDRVINIKNNYELVFCEQNEDGDYVENEELGTGITNGECGFITDIIYEEDDDTGKPTKIFIVKYEEGFAKYRVNELENLLHAYCMTIHKSQGSGWKAILFPVHSSHYHMLENNLIYTAWTRSRIFAMAVGNESTLRKAVQTFKAVTRYTTLAPRLKYEKSKHGL